MAQASSDLTIEEGQGTRDDRIMKRVFLSPTVFVLLALSIFPLLWSLGISFTDIQRGGSTTARVEEATGETGTGFLGLDWSLSARNYDRLLHDSRLWIAARNTFIYVFLGVTIQYVIGLLLALVLNQQFRMRSLVRVIFLIPMMTTPVVVGYTGRMMFDSFKGPIADLLRHAEVWWAQVPVIGSDINLYVPWMTETKWARFTMVLMDSWQWIPFMMLILLAGMQAIPDDVYEAARVDGASSFQIFRRITFPMLLPLSATVILIRGLEIFKIIDVIVVTTGGGPGSATESLTMYIYKTALTFGNYGYAAAISFALLVLVVIFSTLFLGLIRRFIPRDQY
ncbi:carbohydrate ABC transporter permease [Aggregatilinea lenta]|uniref:carbohydrate ABC transporter permease n=1 Tax=Aggregatilinea lenta TaxID=913108 RepID=UPI000E5A9862|nr:sugar ABC transporter permease [Aggregatilinea lenta]